MQDLIQIVRLMSYVCFCGEHARTLSIIPFGIVWFVSKHKHKENLGTFGSVVERLETFWKRFNALRAFWEIIGAFSRLGRLGSIFPYSCM